MNKMTRRIAVSVLTLVLTVVALGTTTFAWFTLSNVAQVGAIEGEITGGDGLEIRLVSGVNETAWKSNLSNADVNTFITSVYGGKKFDAVTTTDGKSFNALTQNASAQLVYQELDGQNDPVAGKNDKYLEFEIQFRSQSAGEVKLTELSFDSQTQEISIDGSGYMQVADTEGTKHKVAVTAANAARVAFFDGETILRAYQNNASAYAEDDGVVSGNAIVPAKEGQWSYLTVSKGLVFYDGTNEHKEEATGVTPALPGVASTILGAKEVKDLALADHDTKFNVAAERATKAITVRVWVEGWDPDTYDVIFAQTLKFTMKFEKIS